MPIDSRREKLLHAMQRELRHSFLLEEVLRGAPEPEGNSLPNAQSWWSGLREEVLKRIAEDRARA